MHSLQPGCNHCDRPVDRSWIWKTERVIPSDASLGKQILDELLIRLRENAWHEHEVFGVHLSMEEALVNAIKHGNGLDRNKNVRVCCQLASDLVRIEIADEGPGFNPAAVPDCTEDENLEIPSGRGLMLMRSFMSLVQYNDRGNTVLLEKSRAQAG